MQQLIVSKGWSDIFMWVNIAQIALQIAVILVFARQGIIAMVTAYSVYIAVWTIAWQQFTRKIVNYGVMSLFKDLLPFMFTALAACAVAYVAASFVHGMLLRMVIKIVVTTMLYAAAMKISGAQVMKECVNYLTRKKG